VVAAQTAIWATLRPAQLGDQHEVVALFMAAEVLLLALAQAIAKLAAIDGHAATGTLQLAIAEDHPNSHAQDGKTEDHKGGDELHCPLSYPRRLIVSGFRLPESLWKALQDGLLARLRNRIVAEIDVEEGVAQSQVLDLGRGLAIDRRE